jgi:O-antigen/teichoic acid export membrane protein
LGIFLLGDYMLSFFGRGYSENALLMLDIFAVASIPNSLIIIYLSIKRINNEINSVVLINFVLALVTILGSYLLTQRLGLVGVGSAWLLANVLVSLLIGIKVFHFKLSGVLYLRLMRIFTFPHSVLNDKNK